MTPPLSPAIPPIRPTSWYSPSHRSSKLSAEPPDTSAQPLWRLVKDGHVAEARVRPIAAIGVELRFEWNGDLHVSQVFKAWEELEAAATEKRWDLEARGWPLAWSPTKG